MPELVQMPWRPALVPEPAPADLYARAEVEIEEWLTEAEEEAEAIIERSVVIARRDAARIRADATEYAAHTLARAETEAARMRQEASDAVGRLLHRARLEAEGIRRAARAEIAVAPNEDAPGPAPAAPPPVVDPPRLEPPRLETPRLGPARPETPRLEPARPETRLVPAPEPAPYLTRPAATRAAPVLDGIDDVVTRRRRWRMPLVRRGRRVA